MNLKFSILLLRFWCWPVRLSKRHRQPSHEHSVADERVQVIGQCSDYKPPPNSSGCARSELYDYSGRRGRKEPEVLAASSLKRLFVENQPYLVGGYCQHGLLNDLEPSGRGVCSKFFCSEQRLRMSVVDFADNIFSVPEKYKYMKETCRKQLAFGKSKIHGFGIFAKHPYKGGDMVIEYTGELVRPSIADRREHFIYNSLVGAGTYLFRVDDARVIDATRAGSIAHLINHSCAPNCYSRVISANGDEHIIIFAKRDIILVRSVHGYALKHMHISHVEIANQIIHTYAKYGYVVDARVVFNRMRTRDLVSWTSMMTGYIYHCHIDEAINLFRLLQKENLNIDSVTLIGLIQALSQLGCLSFVKEVHCFGYRFFHGNELSVNNSLITTYAKSGKLHMARNIFEQMTELCLTSWYATIATYNGYSK